MWNLLRIHILVFETFIKTPDIFFHKNIKNYCIFLTKYSKTSARDSLAPVFNYEMAIESPQNTNLDGGQTSHFSKCFTLNFAKTCNNI